MKQGQTVGTKHVIDHYLWHINNPG